MNTLSDNRFPASKLNKYYFQISLYYRMNLLFIFNVTELSVYWGRVPIINVDSHVSPSTCFRTLRLQFLSSDVVSNVYLWLVRRTGIAQLRCAHRSSAWRRDGVPGICYFTKFWLSQFIIRFGLWNVWLKKNWKNYQKNTVTFSGRPTDPSQIHGPNQSVQIPNRAKQKRSNFGDNLGNVR